MSRDPDAAADAVVVRPDAVIDGGSAGEGGIEVVGPAAPMAPVAPMMPMAPAPPALMDCRPGWAPAETGDHCEPAWAPGAVCADDEALFVGERACTRIGAACGDDGWPSGLPTTGAIVFVQAGAGAGGDGTRGRPFATIAAGLADASDGTVVAIAEGRYTEEISVPAGVTLWGACVARTTIVGDDPTGPDFTVLIEGAGARVRNLRLEGARMQVLGTMASVEVTDVLFERVHGWGLRVTSGQAVVRGVVARDAAETDDGPWNQIYGEEGAQMVIERIAVERCERGIGIFDVGSTMELRDVVVRDNAGDFATGMNFGASLTAEGLVIDRASEWSFMVSSETSSASMTDVLVRDSGHSLVANFGALLEVERVATIGGGEGLRTDLVRSRLIATDVLVRDTESFGLTANEEAAITVTRAKIVNVGRQGLLVQNVATATVTDLDVDGSALPGVEVRLSSSARITRLRTTDTVGAGVRLEGEASSLELDDATIVSPQPDEAGGGGIGIEVSATTLTASELAVSGAHEVGVFVSGPAARLDALDLTVSDTVASEAAPRSGRGIALSDGARLSVGRAQIDGSAAEAFVAAGGASATIPELSIDGAAGDWAVLVSESASLVSERVHVGGAAAGAIAVVEATFALSDLNVRDAGGDGLVVQSDGSVTGLLRSAFDGVVGAALRLDPGGQIGAEIADVSVTRLGLVGIRLEHGMPASLRRIAVAGGAGVAILARGRGTIVDASDIRLGGPETIGIARGIEIADGARWSSSATVLEGASVVGVLATGIGSDAVLRGIPLDQCGLGVSVQDGASLELEEFAVRDATIAGIQVGPGGGLDLRRGEVRACVVGANVQDPSYDVRRLTLDDVVFAANSTDVSLEALAVPGPTP